MEHYIVIRLNELNKKINQQIVGKESFIINTSTLNKLFKYDNYPIKKEKAILHILRFLQEVDRIRNSKTLLTIHSDVLIAMFSRDTYKRYKNILSELEIMSNVSYDDNTFYTVNQRAMQYRLHNEYNDANDLALVINKGKSPTTLNCEIQGIDPIHVKTIKKVQIDYHKAIVAELNYYNEVTNNVNALQCRINTILALNGERYIKKGVKQNRIYTSVSNLSKVSRPHLHVGTARFVNIDIVNCQPLILAYLLRANNLPLDDKYIRDVQDGVLYEQFLNNEMTRDKVKVELYKSIYFDFKPNKLINLRFSELYPQTHKSLEIMALNCEKTGIKMASLLQNIEAEVFNNLKVDKSKYFFTLFDAIYFTSKDDITYISDQIKAKFLSYEIDVRINVEL